MTTRTLVLLSLCCSLTALAQTTPPPPPDVEAPAPAPARVKITLKDQQIIRGTLLSQSAVSISIQLSGGGVSELPIGSVEKIEHEAQATVHEGGEIWPADPNRTRYFVTPSAMMLRQGELSFSQKELLFTTFSYGLTDWLSLQVGSVIPALFFNKGANFVGALKVGHAIGERFHLAAGAQALVLPVAVEGLPVGAGVAFVTATYGTPELHFSLSAGKPFAFSSKDALAGPWLFTVSGNARVTRSLALVSETWLLPSASEPNLFYATMGGVRIMGEHVAVDLGLLELGTDRTPTWTAWVPLPWVDFTYNF